MALFATNDEHKRDNVVEMTSLDFYDKLRESFVEFSNHSSSASSSTSASLFSDRFWTLHEKESRPNVIRVDLHFPDSNADQPSSNSNRTRAADGSTKEGGNGGDIFRPGNILDHNGGTNENAKDVFTTKKVELRHLVFMAPLTYAGRTVFPMWSEEMITGAILGIHHFNNGITTVVPQMPTDCPVKFTLEVFDTSLSEINSSAYLVRDLLPRSRQGNQNNILEQIHPPAPTALLASLASRITKPLAVVSGRSNLVQLSYTSTADEFDYKDQYPLLARTTVSDTEVSSVAIDYLQNIAGTTHCVLLHFDANFERAFLKVASSQIDRALVVAPFQLSRARFGLSLESQEDALEFVRASTYRHVVLNGPFSYFENLMIMARSLGLVGPHMFWFGIFDHKPNGAVEKPDMFDAVHTMSVMSLKVANDMLGEDPHVDAFVSLYDEFRSSPESLSHLKRKTPKHLWDHPGRRMYNMSNFQLAHTVSFTMKVYDSVVALCMATCHAAGYLKQTDEDKEGKNENNILVEDHYDDVSDLGGYRFDAHELYRSLVQNTTFDGAYGRMVLDPKTGTRDGRTVPFVISNVIVTTNATTGKMNLTLHPIYDMNLPQDNSAESGSLWSPIKGSPPFIYRDESTTPPNSLPPVALRQIPLVARSIGFGMSSLCIVLSIACAIWTLWMARPAKITTTVTPKTATTSSLPLNASTSDINSLTLTTTRRNRVVRASQPVFLFLISVGSLLMGVAGIVENLHYTMPRWLLDVSCMLSVWLFGMGYTITFAALYSKLRRVNRLYYSQQRASKSRAPSLIFDVHVLLPCIVLVVMQLMVLISWTVYAPLTYVKKTTDEVDIYGRPTEEYGTCQSTGSADNDNRNPLFFWIPFGTVIALSTAGTLFQAYRARNVASDYSESSHIFVAELLIFEAYVVGLPVRLMGPPTSDFVNAITVPLTAFTLLAAIFAPKIGNAWREARRQEGKSGDAETPLLEASNIPDEGNIDSGDMEHNSQGGNDGFARPESSLPYRPPSYQQQRQQREPPSSLGHHGRQAMEGIQLTEERLLSIIAMTGESVSKCSMLVLAGEGEQQQWRTPRRNTRECRPILREEYNE